MRLFAAASSKGMRSIVVVLLGLAACGDDLPAPGMCEVATSGEVPEVTSVPLAGHATGDDDLRYSPQLGKLARGPHDPSRRPASLATAAASGASATRG